MSLFKRHPHHATTSDALVVGVGVEGHQGSHLQTVPEPGASFAPMPTPPRTIQYAFWGWLVIAAIRIYGAVDAIATRQDTVDILNGANGANVPSGPRSTPLPESQIQSAANFIVGTDVVVSLLFAALFVLFAFQLRAGRNWARILLIFAAIVDLLLFVQSGAYSVLSILAALVSLTTIVLSYLRPSTDYVAQMREARAQRKG